jgi:predicted transcriptional regulator of viral defense system
MTHSGSKAAAPPFDAALAALALRQHGVVSLSQLVALGMSRSGVQSRVDRGRLHRVHQGVYSVGHSLLSIEGRYMAAVLACGPGAALSHRAAADHLGIRNTSRARIDVTAPGARGRSRRGIDAHESASLAPDDVAVTRDIPCTTVARTLLDLAEVVDRRAVERAIERAEQLRLFDLRAVERALDRANGRTGASVVRRLLARADWRPTLTREELEERFVALCRGAGVPQPEVNAWLPLGSGEGMEVDFLWRAERLIAETDGWETHGTRRAFERDRLRDQELALAGFRVVRFTWRQVEDDPDRVATTLRKLVV